ncbi:MAG: hypothetical protein JW934_10735 [Anaerolineae bacterium]|nr:hypothetical protein [Anaerolineae bacterium]
MSQVNDQVTISEAVARVLADLDGPISTDEFYGRVLAIRPSAAKNPKQSIYTQIRWDENGRTLAFLDSKTIAPLHVALRGVRFRIALSRSEVSHGALLIRPALLGFYNSAREPASIEWLDEEGNTLVASVTAIKELVSGLGGQRREIEHSAIDLAGWMKAKHAQPDDHILVTIVSWAPKCFRIELEKAKERKLHRDEIAAKNAELANIFWQMLEAARDESIYVHAAVVAAYLRLSDPQGYPGDHWFEVVTQDPRMQVDDWQITYPENRSPLEAMLYGRESDQDVFPPVSFTKVEGEQVYIFKANLKHRPGLWRRIEIQGQNTLADFNSTLVGAFRHDSDHLGGFWRLVTRGKTGKRVREIELGTVEPFGGGDGADVQIAELGLKPDDRLKYVFDFGDWIEHEILLEAIAEPEAGGKYPRVAAQNKPRHRYCERCQKRGIETVATYICIDCSNRQDREVLICDKCARKHHEDHYLDEILY